MYSAPKEYLSPLFKVYLFRDSVSCSSIGLESTKLMMILNFFQVLEE